SFSIIRHTPTTTLSPYTTLFRSSDYNAIVVQGLKDRDFWVIDTFCKQSKMNAAVAWMCQYQKSLPDTVVVHWLFESQFWNDAVRSEEHTSELQSREKLVCRLLLE